MTTIQFTRRYDYAHDGRRIERFEKGQVVEVSTDLRVHDATFLHDATIRDKAADVVEGEELAPILNLKRK